jgi:hypothetical protein
MNIIVKTILRLRITTVAALLLAGFAAGFPIGQSIGFSTGSEWALVQADLLAKEVGLFMPVDYKQGRLRVIVKQPRHLYKHAWKRADRHDAVMRHVNKGERPLTETASLARNTYITQ